MPRRVYGTLSLVTASIALALAAVIGARQSLLLGLAYVALAAVSLLVLIVAFCAKCAGRARCGHVLPGRLASALFPRRRGGEYTSVELLLTAVALVVLFALPHAWLWHSPIALAGFWILVALASVEIRARVCPACDNLLCPLQTKRPL